MLEGGNPVDHQQKNDRATAHLACHGAGDNITSRSYFNLYAARLKGYKGSGEQKGMGQRAADGIDHGMALSPTSWVFSQIAWPWGS